MVEDDPDWRVYANLMECLYQESPVRFPVAGTVESIRQITPQTLYDCHRAFYTPSNMVLVCVGDVDPDRVAAEAEAILPGEAGGDVERDYGAQEGQTPARREICQTMEVSMPMFLAGYKCRPQSGGQACGEGRGREERQLNTAKAPFQRGRFSVPCEIFLSGLKNKD